MASFSVAFWSLAFAGAVALAAFVAAPLLAARARLVALALALSVVGGAFGVFWSGGAPRPGAPLADRIEALRAPGADPAAFTLQERIIVLRSIAEENPEDDMAIRFLGDAYLEAGRTFEAVAAREALASRSGPEDGYAFAALGEALVALNEGAVTPEAVRAFEEALARDESEPLARWHLGLAQYQGGDRREAARAWGALLLDLDPMASARIAHDAVERLSRPAAPVMDAGAVDVAAMAGAVDDPEAFAEGMVSRLSARLADDGGDLPGWLALARARAVLGDQEGARQALDAAEEATTWTEGERLLLRSARVVLDADAREGEG